MDYIFVMDQLGNPLLGFQKKVVAIRNGQGLYSSKILGFKDSSRNPL